MKSAEQQARDLLQRLGVEGAQSYTSGDLIELANLMALVAKAPPALTFTVSREQAAKVEKWVRKRIHAHCHAPHGIEEWAFSRRSGIGVSVKVRCTCGLELDVTDYENW
jgi:hypothetical protein